MRKQLTFLLALCHLCAIGQEFRCIVPGEDRFFSDGSLLGLRVIGSEPVPEGTLHHFHHDLRPVDFGDSSGCNPNMQCNAMSTDVAYYTMLGASWMGTYMLEQPDGNDLFFNLEGDTIRINTLAGAGESWTLLRWNNMERLEATVSAVVIETVLGTSQLVKTLTLQAFNADGIAIAHPLNGTEWKLSQYDGLV